jgi:hypothetical protein
MVESTHQNKGYQTERLYTEGDNVRLIDVKQCASQDSNSDEASMKYMEHCENLVESSMDVRKTITEKKSG